MYYNLHEFNRFYATSNSDPIYNFTIYGERHSGTNWLEKVISNTFKIPVSWNFDHKHFFGCCDWNKLNNAHNTLFIGIVRNIYNWIKGMEKIPYHLYTNKVLSIKPWTSFNSNNNDIYCDSHWYDHSKYKDIFDMRHHKIQFLYLYMPYLVNNYVFIRYEDLISDYTLIINYISYIYNLPINFQYKTYRDTTKLKISDLKQNTLDKINDGAIWSTENMVGYRKLNSLIDKNYIS